jgi:thioester reductase-like protein
MAVQTRHEAGSGSLLLTGATGFVGMEILARYVERTDRPIYALVRADSEQAARERVEATLRSFFGSADAVGDQVIAVPGDIEQPGLGLARSRRELLAERVDTVIHAAASVSFSLPLPEARAINVAGTQRVLEFAELCRDRGGLQHFSYISTAYVAGTHTGQFSEDQLDVGQDFRNSYERSKFEAEKLVRARDAELPIQVLRPSIVVGERTSGWTASFNVLYSPLKAFAGGTLPAIPARRSAPVDVVPVDYVADAVFELSNRPADERGTYHLVAGPRATTVGDLIDLSAARLGRRKPFVLPPRLYRQLIHPLLVRRSRGKTRRALEQSTVFFPYYSMRVRYRDDHARSRLEPVGVEVTPVDRYFDRLVDYAISARWGRETVGRAEARARAESLSR